MSTALPLMDYFQWYVRLVNGINPSNLPTIYINKEGRKNDSEDTYVRAVLILTPRKVQHHIPTHQGLPGTAASLLPTIIPHVPVSQSPRTEYFWAVVLKALMAPIFAGMYLYGWRARQASLAAHLYMLFIFCSVISCFSNPFEAWAGTSNIGQPLDTPKISIVCPSIPTI